MAKKQPGIDKTQKEMEALVARALSEPGVAEAVELYERVEAVYATISGATRISQSTANSTDGATLGWE
jgi:hypothetical protein